MTPDAIPDEDEIRRLIEQRSPALAVRDAATLTAPYAPDVVLFDVVGLRHAGAEAQPLG